MKEAKHQCDRCGSKRQRNLKYNPELRVWLCIRCMLGNTVNQDDPRKYRMQRREKKEVIRYKRSS